MGNECGEERDNGGGGKEWLTMFAVIARALRHRCGLRLGFVSQYNYTCEYLSLKNIMEIIFAAA
jgi:hypothetical protein